MLGATILASGTDILVGTGADRIYYLRDAQNQFQVVNEFKTGQIPSWIQLSHNKNFLFATNEGSKAIQSYQVNKQGGLINLSLIGTISSTGDSPCFMSITPDDTLLTVANYGDNYATFNIGNDGKLS